MEIHGDVNVSYGLNDLRKNKNQTYYIKDVCKQIIFHEKLINKQKKSIGEERFWIVSYEKFCENPVDLVRRVSEKILHRAINSETLKNVLKPFPNANQIKIENDKFREIQTTLHTLGSDHGEKRIYEHTRTSV